MQDTVEIVMMFKRCMDDVYMHVVELHNGERSGNHRDTFQSRAT